MKVFLRIFFILFVGNISYSTKAQDSLQTQPKQKLVIGITETPPFIMKKGNSYSGISVTSWNMINDELELEFEYKAYPSLADLLTAVENAEVDFSINPITVTDQRMKKIDFSQPYFISYTAIAKEQKSQIITLLKNLWSWKFISALLILLGVIFIFGVLIWIFERKGNQEEFRKGGRGLADGFWWSAVTMTTVGYGDKSPRTTGGRVVGFIWMFMAIIIISSLTAGIASALTVQNISSDISSVADLERFDVTTVSTSSSQEFLQLYNIQHEEVLDANEGIQAILEGNTTLFVYDQPILKFEIEQRGLEDELEILKKTLKKDYYSYSFPKDSDLVKTINPELVSILKTMEWSQVIKEYK